MTVHTDDCDCVLEDERDRTELLEWEGRWADDRPEWSELALPPSGGDPQPALAVLNAQMRA